jgi:capsular polysaccharide biosynthesis protein
MLELITYLPWTDPRDPIYLTIVNLLLGIIVVVLVIYLLVVMFLDFTDRRKKHKQELEAKTDLKDILTRLGVTMRDGGEKLKKNDGVPKK